MHNFTINTQGSGGKKSNTQTVSGTKFLQYSGAATGGSCGVSCSARDAPIQWCCLAMWPVLDGSAGWIGWMGKARFAIPAGTDSYTDNMYVHTDWGTSPGSTNTIETGSSSDGGTDAASAQLCLTCKGEGVGRADRLCRIRNCVAAYPASARQLRPGCACLMCWVSCQFSNLETCRCYCWLFLPPSVQPSTCRSTLLPVRQPASLATTSCTPSTCEYDSWPGCQRVGVLQTQTRCLDFQPVQQLLRAMWATGGTNSQRLGLACLACSFPRPRNN